MTRAKHAQAACVLKITLSGSRPPIWRRFCVPAEISLDRLHDIIQIVIGWHNCHEHCFEIGGRRYTESPEDAATEGREDGSFRLCDLVPRAGGKFGYEYDFGDGWYHTLLVEQVAPVPREHYACIACTDGKRSCPPEDVGGIDGYYEFLAALKDPDHPEHKSCREWSGGDFDQSAFDLEYVNLELAKYARWSRPRLLNQELKVREFSDA